MNRRTRFAAAGLAAVALAGATSAGTAMAGRESSNNEVRNVIYLLGDGMGRTHVTAARERYYGADGKLVMETLPNVGQNRTYSVEPGSGQPGGAVDGSAHPRWRVCGAGCWASAGSAAHARQTGRHPAWA